MGYEHQYWSPVDRSCLPERSTPPFLRRDEEHLHRRLIQEEGLYDIEVWPVQQRAKITFHFYHHRLFQPPVVIMEKELEEDPYDWFNNQYQLQPLLFPHVKGLLLPVLERDEAISVLKLNFETGVRRVRDGKRHLIYLARLRGMCENWAVTHTHAVRVKIVDERDKTMLAEEYPCAQVWAGIERYRQALDDLNTIRMEKIL